MQLPLSLSQSLKIYCSDLLLRRHAKCRKPDGDGRLQGALALFPFPLPGIGSYPGGTVVTSDGAVGTLNTRLNGRHPIQIFFQVAVTAGAIAGLVHEVVASLRPQILQLLLVRPASGSPLALKIA